MDVQERAASRGELPAGDTALRKRGNTSSDYNDNDKDNVKESDGDDHLKKSNGGPPGHTALHDNMKKADNDAGDATSVGGPAGHTASRKRIDTSSDYNNNNNNSDISASTDDEDSNYNSNDKNSDISASTDDR
jgi:hypothetical protein